MCSAAYQAFQSVILLYQIDPPWVKINLAEFQIWAVKTRASEQGLTYTPSQCHRLIHYSEYHVYTSNCLHNIRQNHWTMKYRSQWSNFILKSSIKSYWLISPRYHVHTSNSLQNIRQNHWTMKYRSQWPTFNLMSNIKSYWLISPRYHVYKSNSLQDIRLNHWTLTYV